MTNTKQQERGSMKFTDAVNWEWVHAHHTEADGKVQPGAWCRRIIEHARANGYTRPISERGACIIINRNLY